MKFYEVTQVLKLEQTESLCYPQQASGQYHLKKDEEVTPTADSIRT